MKFSRFSFYIAIVLVLVASLTACKNNFEDPSAGMAERNDQQIRDYLNANQLQNRVGRTNSGLYYFFTDTTSTRNKRAELNDEVEFTYVLSYIDGNKTILLDSTNQIKSVHIPFIRGIVVAGLEESLLLMKEGQKGRFFMPSNIAFGSGDKLIPPYVPVVFDIQLKSSRTEVEQIQDYITIKNLGSPTIEGSSDSVWVYRLTQGTGPKITPNQTVTVDYTAKTLRGSTFFADQKSEELNTGGTVPTAGLIEGIKKLYVGDKALLIFASSLGYGPQGINNDTNYIVPPYTPLVYEVTVKSAK